MLADIGAVSYGAAPDAPTSMAFATDGRLFVAQQTGALRVITRDAFGAGTLLPTPFVTVRTIPSASAENGLLGVTTDPDFPANGYVYVYYTVLGSGEVFNRVSRFTAADADPDPAVYRPGNTADPASERVLTDLDPVVANPFHNAGALHFGADGKLYVAVGENGRSADAQSLDTRRGKLLRLNPDGSIPTDNPFYDVATGLNRQIWALGLRNPFTFAVQKGTGRMFINDVGSSGAGQREEVNEAVAGANYGWPGIEGVRTTQPLPAIGAYHDPFYAYPRLANGDLAITGGTFYNPDAPLLGAEYVAKYFFADYGLGQVNVIDPDSVSPQPSNFLTVRFNPVDLDVGPDGSLYVLFRGGSLGVQRFAPVSVLAPRIIAQPQPATATEGQPATFEVTLNPDNQLPVQYQWLRDGADIPGATGRTYTTPATSPADDGAVFTVRITHRYGSILSEPATLTVRPAPAEVVGRHVFYNNSIFDGRSPAANEADDAAVAPDKAALLPGQSASFSNVTGYSRGINGVMVDVAHLPATAVVTAENFVFRTGSGDGVWAGAAAPSAVTLRRGAGDGGSDRVTLTFPDNRLVNRWLHVTFTPPAAPGSAPATPDMFAFGNLRGETGDPLAPGAARVAVNTFDVLRSRRALGTRSAAIDNPNDHTRDGRVNALDYALTLRNRGHSLLLATLPPPPPAAATVRDQVLR